MDCEVTYRGIQWHDLSVHIYISVFQWGITKHTPLPRSSDTWQLCHITRWFLHSMLTAHGTGGDTTWNIKLKAKGSYWALNYGSTFCRKVVVQHSYRRVVVHHFGVLENVPMPLHSYGKVLVGHYCCFKATTGNQTSSLCHLTSRLFTLGPIVVDIKALNNNGEVYNENNND